MKFQKHFTALYIVLVLFSVYSCDEAKLDIADPNAITSGNFWSRPEDVQLALNTLYPTFNGLMDGANTASNLRSDAIVLAATDFAPLAQYALFTNGADNGQSDDFWGSAYGLIFSANTILQEIENVPFSDESLKSQYIAEASFFRGAAYFRLAHLYGDAPIVTIPAVSASDFDRPKSSAQEVWDQAIADLIVARDGLPSVSEMTGRVNSWVATGFLGKAYLYRAGYLNEDSYFALAAAEFKKIIDSGSYGLIDNWVENFLGGTFENNLESLYEAQYDILGSEYGATQSRPFDSSAPGISAEIINKPSEWILNEMSRELDLDGELDVRLLNTLYWLDGLPLFGTPFSDLGNGIECGGGGGPSVECSDFEDISGEDEWINSEIIPNLAQVGATPPEGEELVSVFFSECLLNGTWVGENFRLTYSSGCTISYGYDDPTGSFTAMGNTCVDVAASSDGGNLDGFFRKYVNVDLACEDANNATNNERILRYADILLMYAEAVVMSNGDLQEAINAVNAVRERANLATGVDANGNTLDASNLMAEIEHQRVMEFVLEGQRYYDLIRWGRLKSTLEASGFPDAASNVDEMKHKYFPIPLDEINANALIEQNPLW